MFCVLKNQEPVVHENCDATVLHLIPNSLPNLSLPLHPAHLYRIEAMNSVGSAYSSWVATNTLQSGE